MRALNVSLAALLVAAPALAEAEETLAALSIVFAESHKDKSPTSSIVVAQASTPSQPVAPAQAPDQQPSNQQAQPAPQAASPAATPTDQAASEDSFSRDELKKLLAPIALYPDPLLAQLLPASAYPLQIVQAHRLLEKNVASIAKGDFSSIDKTTWDPAVKAIARFPDIIKKLNDDIAWTTDLGDAFVNQQKDVADVIQELRAEAMKGGALKSTPQQTVSTSVVSTNAGGGGGAQSGGGPTTNVITIQPTDPSVIYVPSYDPYAAYQPYYGAAPLLGFGAGIALGAWAANNYWNWGRGGVWTGNVNNINGPWRPGGDYRPGNGSKPGIGRPGGVGGVGGPGGVGGVGGPGRPGGVGGVGGAGRPGGVGGVGGAGRPGGVGGVGGAGRPGGVGGVGGAGKPGGVGGVGGAGNRPAKSNRPSAGNRPAGANRPAGGNRGANRPAARPSGGMNRANFGGGPGAGGGFRGGGGGFRGGGHHGGGHRGGGHRGGGHRRSDIRLKHDIALLGRLDNGIGFYRFAYNGSDTAYVGVMAQEVLKVLPRAVSRGRDGYLRVDYGKLGLRFQTYAEWLAAGARAPIRGSIKNAMRHVHRTRAAMTGDVI